MLVEQSRQAAERRRQKTLEEGHRRLERALRRPRPPERPALAAATASSRRFPTGSSETCRLRALAGGDAPLDRRAARDAALPPPSRSATGRKCGGWSGSWCCNSSTRPGKTTSWRWTISRSSVGLRGYAQIDPKVEYKREGMRIFEQMWTSVGERVTDLIFRMEQLDEGFVGSTWKESRGRSTKTPPIGRRDRRAAAGGHRRHRSRPQAPADPQPPAARRPQRSLPLRQRQEVQALPRERRRGLIACPLALRERAIPPQDRRASRSASFPFFSAPCRPPPVRERICFCGQPLRSARPFCESNSRRRVSRRQAARRRFGPAQIRALCTLQRRKLAPCPPWSGANCRPVRLPTAKSEAMASKKPRFRGRRCVWSDVFRRLGAGSAPGDALLNNFPRFEGVLVVGPACRAGLWRWRWIVAFAFAGATSLAFSGQRPARRVGQSPLRLAALPPWKS